MEYIPIIIVGGIAYAVTNLPYIKDMNLPVSFLDRKVDYTQPVYALSDNTLAELDEYEQNGYPIALQKVSNLTMTNINDAWKPYGPPRQMESKGLYDTYQEEARRNAYVKTYGIAPFINRHEMEIPIASAQQSNPNVSIPQADLTGTPLEPLMYYPRAWIDDENYDKGTAFADSDFRVWGSNMMPSEWMPSDTHDDEGRMSRFMNPWGLNGNYIRLFNRQQFDEQKNARPETHRDSVLNPNLRHYKYQYGQPQVNKYKFR